MAIALIATVGVADAAIVTADQDAFIFGSSPSENFGDTTLLLGKAPVPGSTYSRKAYIQFDTSQLVIPNDEYALIFNVVDSGTGVTEGDTEYNFSVWGLNHSLNADGWSESGITWNNAPENDTTSSNGFLSGATSLGTFDITGKGDGQVIVFSSSAMDLFMDNIGDGSDDYVTFMIARNTLADSENTYVHGFASTNHSTLEGPQLSSLSNTKLGQVPEPASLVVWSLLAGLALAVGWRRRR